MTKEPSLSNSDRLLQAITILEVGTSPSSVASAVSALEKFKARVVNGDAHPSHAEAMKASFLQKVGNAEDSGQGFDRITEAPWVLSTCKTLDQLAAQVSQVAPEIASANIRGQQQSATV